MMLEKAIGRCSFNEIPLFIRNVCILVAARHSGILQ